VHTQAVRVWRHECALLPISPGRVSSGGLVYPGVRWLPTSPQPPAPPERGVVVGHELVPRWRMTRPCADHLSGCGRALWCCHSKPPGCCCCPLAPFCDRAYLLASQASVTLHLNWTPFCPCASRLLRARAARMHSRSPAPYLARGTRCLVAIRANATQGSMHPPEGSSGMVTRRLGQAASANSLLKNHERRQYRCLLRYCRPPHLPCSDRRVPTQQRPPSTERGVIRAHPRTHCIWGVDHALPH
jgi:hypothetical protein